MNEEFVMTEEESKIALFKLNYEYMKHSQNERLILYNEYKYKRELIKQALIRSLKLEASNNNLINQGEII